MLVFHSTKYTTGTTTCTPYYWLHTVTYLVPAVPIGKLLQYSHRQGCGDTHTITLWVVTLGIIHTVAACISVCTLHITAICLVFLLSCAALLCTMYSLYNVLQFNTLLYCTSRPRYHECCTIMHDSHTMQLLTLHILCQWLSNVPP